MSGEWDNFKALLLAAVDVIAFLGNTSLFVVLLRKSSLRTQTNAFILNLAAADLLVATVNMPLTIATLLYGVWMFGKLVCTLSAFLNLLSFVASVMSLAAVSMNRYYFVVKWTTYQLRFSKRKCAVYITLMWGFSAVLCLPPLLGWAKYCFIARYSQCFVDWSSSASYLFSMAAICLLGPATTMVFSYWNIWTFSSKSVKKLKSRGKCEEISMRNVNTFLPPDNRTLRLIGPGKVAQTLDSSASRELATAETGTSAACTRSSKGSGVGRNSGHDHCEKENTAVERFPPQRHEENRRSISAKRRMNCAIKPYIDAKLTKTLLIIVVTFCLCWSPYTVTCILQLFLPLSIPRAVWFGVMWLGCANSACNPLIYMGTSRKIRKEFLEMFKGRFCR